MTREEFNAKFQILNQIADGSVRSYHALSSSGAVVMAHFLAEDSSAESSAILARLDTLEPERKSRVVKIADVDGSPVVVTKFILDFESLQQWLELDTPGAEESSSIREQAPPAAPVDSLEPTIPEPTAAPGVLSADADATHPLESIAIGHDPAPAPEPRPAPLTQPAPDHEPGEFTRMFQVPSAGGVPEQETAAAPEGPPASPPFPAPEDPPEVPSGPGEFTRMFQASSPLTPPVHETAPPPQPASPAAPTAASDAPADAPLAEPSTPEMETPVAEPRAEAPMPEPAAAPLAPPPAPSAKLPDASEGAAGPGEFTQLFQVTAPSEPPSRREEAPSPSAPPIPPAPAPSEPGEFTRMFQSPLAAEPTGHSVMPPPPSMEPPRTTAPAAGLHGGSAPPPPSLVDPPMSSPQPSAEAGPGRPLPLRNAVDRIDKVADGLDTAADLRLPEQRKVDLPSASPSLPGLNLHSPRASPPMGMPPAGLPGTPASPELPKPAGGEFTRIFGQASSPLDGSNRVPSTPSAPLLGQAPGVGEIARQARDAHGYAERLQGAMGQHSHSGAPVGPPPLAAAPPPPPSGAGEYTRIIAAQTPSPQPVSSPPPVSPPPAHPEAAAGTPTWLLVVGLALVLLIVLALVLYIVLRPA